MTTRPHLQRRPGPAGLTPHPSGRPARGPLGVRLGVFAAPKAAIRKAKSAAAKLKMPKPGGDAKTKLARVVDWPLYGKRGPSERDVLQGELRNCPLASLLTALAYTAVGDRHIRRMIKENRTAVEVDLRGVKDDLAETPTGNTITAARTFVVEIAGASHTVSDVLYTDDADRNWSLIYMGSQSEVLWPAVIEKAYAKKMGSYADLDSLFGAGKTLNDVWADVVGKKPDGGFEVKKATPDGVIRAAAAVARRIPTVAASKLKLTMSSGATRWHGFAVLGMHGRKIELLDPATQKKLALTLDAFRNDFLAVLYGTP